MNARDMPLGEDDLHVHVDGRLGGERRIAVAAYLAEHPEIADGSEREDGVSAFFWRDAGLGYAVSAAASREPLTQVATAIHEDLNRLAPSLPGGTL